MKSSALRFHVARWGASIHWGGGGGWSLVRATKTEDKSIFGFILGQSIKSILLRGLRRPCIAFFWSLLV